MKRRTIEYDMQRDEHGTWTSTHCTHDESRRIAKSLSSRWCEYKTLQHAQSIANKFGWLVNAKMFWWDRPAHITDTRHRDIWEVNHALLPNVATVI